MAKVAAQLIIYGKRTQTDLAGVVHEIGRAGYDGIEAGNLASVMAAEPLRNLLAINGMELAGIHTGYNGLDQADQLAGYLGKLGAHHLMVSGVGDIKRGLVAYEEAAKTFNKIGERCKTLGVSLCYHNHSWEFQKFGGKTALEILLESTDPRFVFACVDTYWVRHGGQDPAAFLEKWLPRLAFVHLKDIRKDGKFAEIGQGILDWKSIFAVLRKADLPWYCVEQDTTEQDPEESLRVSREYLRDNFSI
jgi:sugar phosphate isomerase/epimerase